MKNKFVLSISLMIVFAGLLPAINSTKAKAQVNRDVKIIHGLVGLIPGQSAQISVVNTGDVDPPEPDKPVQAEIMFLDGEGKILLRSVHLLSAGKSATLKLNGDLIGREGGRVMVRGVVTITVDPPEPDITERINSSFEVIDNPTQRTLFLNPGVIKGFNPQPDPPGSN